MTIRRNDHGGITQGMAITFAVILFALMAGCIAIAVNDGDENGWVPISGQDGDRDRGRNSRGDCDQSDQCSDNDFSPNLEDSPVILCLPSSTCDFGDREVASLMPPDPERLMGAIRVFTQGIGEAAGALAGAIAAGTIGILL